MIPLANKSEVLALSHWMDIIRTHDSALHAHSIAVSELTSCFAAHLKLSTLDRHRLTKGALLHDLGKVRIPLSILRKDGSLTPQEWEVMRAHAEYGHSLLTEAGEQDEMVLSIVRDHHERLDGTGYPRGLQAANISTPVRIVTLCDIFVALTEQRPFAEPFTWDAALSRMFEKRTRLDSSLLNSFAALVTALRAPRRRWTLWPNSYRRRHQQ